MNPREISIIIRNMLLGGNAEAFLAALSSPRKAAAYATECRFLRRCMVATNGDLPHKHITDFLGVSSIPITLYDSAAGEWMREVASYTADLVAMCMLCRALRPRIIFEIGTYHGAGALHWAGNAPEAQVYTLDLYSGSKPTLGTTTTDRFHIHDRSGAEKLVFVNQPEGGRIRCLYGDSATFDFTDFVGKVDLFFIDGAHSYEYVRNDTLRALACCKPGSVIAWHDYGRVGFNGVSRWLHEFARGKRVYRVPGGSLAYHRVGN